MHKIPYLFIILLTAMPCVAQTKFLLEGKITDDHDKAPLTGAVIYSKEYPNQGTAADFEGRFSLSLPHGKHTIICSFIGYEQVEISVEPDRNEYLLIRMKESPQTLGEVVISSKSATERVSNVQIGVERIEIAEMAKTPTMFGERDIIKSLQLLPGVKSEGDGSGGYQVRGGTSAQNLILLDDATIYNAGHLMGFFSTFNDDALTNASLYKGQIPTQFGGATSSVFDINTKSGNRQDYKINGSIGLLSAKLNIEGPIVKDKASFFVAGRRSYLDLFLKASEQFKDNTLNFYDVNAKVNFNIGSKDMMAVSFFSGKDNMGMGDMMEMKWGNVASSLRWFHRFNDRLHSNTTLVYSDYSSSNAIEMLDTEISFGGHNRQFGFKESVVWSPEENHRLNIGFQSTYLDLKSAEWTLNDFHQKEKRNAWENAFWVNEEWKTTDNFEISLGFRLNAFSVLGGSPYYVLDSEGNILESIDYNSDKVVKNHLALEPRFSMNYRITEQQSVKAGYSRTSQNIHAIRNSSSSMPFDRYTMSSNVVKPQTADHISLGYMVLTNNTKYEFSVEGYYKSIRNVYDYKDGKSFNSEIEIERLILGGKGRAFGAEFYGRKNIGRLTGWVAYTLSWSENKIDGINDNQWYTAGNDRRHDVSVVAMYELSEKWHVAATWVYNTGQALTAPSAKYELGGETYYYYAERNGYRAPNYHRLDISFTNTKKKARYTREWSFGLYNAYNRYNPYIITFENDDAKASGTKTVQYSLFGIVPSVSYNFKF